MISSFLSDLWCFSTFTFQQIELIELYIYVYDTRIEYYLCVWTLSLISFHSVKIFRWQESFSIVFNIIIGVWAIVRCIRVQRDRDSDLLRYVYIYIIELVKYTSFITMWKCQDFLPFIFYVKSILAKGIFLKRAKSRFWDSLISRKNLSCRKIAKFTHCALA